MSTVRRWYVLLVAAISLQALTWAVIALLRTVLQIRGSLSPEAVAFSGAVIVIALPIYLIHWIWAQRLSTGERAERSALLRCVYLYGTMAAVLIPWLISADELLHGLLGLLLDPGGGWQGSGRQSIAQGVLGELAALLVLGALWLYHWRVLLDDRAAIPVLPAASALVRRLYVLGLSAGGLLTTVIAGIGVLRWLVAQLAGSTTAGGSRMLVEALAALLVGLPLWLLHWRRAQLLYQGSASREQRSALRKVYLYSVEFFSVLAMITNLTLILVGLLRGLLGLQPAGDLRDALPVVLITALIWAYHHRVLRGDAARTAEAPRQAAVRRVSWYLLAAISLLALLLGLAGVISLLIRIIGTPTFDEALREQLAWSLAALSAGLPLWAIVWRQAQGLALAEGPAGDAERTALVRRIYLYGFLFLATVTVLAGLVLIVYHLLSVALGAASPDRLLINLAQPIAASIIAGGVIAYHGSILRSESHRRQTVEAARAATLQVAVLDPGDGAFGQALLARLHQEFPTITVTPIDLPTEEHDQAAANGAARPQLSRLATVSLIIGPWQMAVPQLSNADLASAVAASPARKLLVAMPAAGWDWAGVAPVDADAAVDQVLHALHQILNDEPIAPQGTLPPLAIAGLVVLGIVVLFLVVTSVVNIVGMLLGS